MRPNRVQELLIPETRHITTTMLRSVVVSTVVANIFKDVAYLKKRCCVLKKRCCVLKDVVYN